MTYNIIRRHQITSNNWSGGTTSELYIYPETAAYQDRDFDFRLSTATVEIETSVFTPLSGVSRTLMVLEGEMTLQHQGHHTVVLKRFDADVFDGGWSTASEGKCTDFNLMTRGDVRGEIQAMRIEEGETMELRLTSKQHLFVYIYEGNIATTLLGKEEVINTGELLCLDPTDTGAIEIKGLQNCALICVRVEVPVL